MESARLRAARLAHHALVAPETELGAAARRMAATQAQQFWAGRWALGIRTAAEVTLSDVDDAFARGVLVRSWTQRGTLHIVAAEDLAWILELTRDRQLRQAAGMHRRFGIEADDITRAERAVQAALSGGNRLTRGEAAGVMAAAGADVAGSRGNHLLSALAVRGQVAFGPVVPREGAPTREQYLIAADDWLPDAAAPAEPWAELLVRYLAGHGPATLEDFRWWAGVPVGVARAARETAGDRVAALEEDLFVVADAVVADAPRGAAECCAEVLALPPFDEYYLSYADRSRVCPPQHRAAIGPTLNGLVRPVLVAEGEVIGTWRHSSAVGTQHLDPEPEPFGPAADAASIASALGRVARFLRG